MRRKKSSKVFISYRQLDSIGHASHLCADLKRHFGSQRIFMAIFAVEAGEDFVERIATALDSSNVLVAVIGTSWLTISDENGRRLDNEKDYVRLEIATALNQGIRIIPVLIDGATMPREADLPDEIKDLARYNAFEISNKRWEYDVGLLIETIEKAVRRQAWPLTTGVIVTSVAIAVLLFVAIGAWINKTSIQVNSADSTTASSPSPVVTTSNPLMTPTPHKTPDKNANDGSATPQASPTPSPSVQEPQLEVPWDSINKAASDLFPGRYIGKVTKRDDPVCNLGVCRQIVYVLLPDSAHNPGSSEPVMVTYQQINGRWQVTAQRMEQNH